MKAIAQIDLNGFYVEDVLVEEGFTGLRPVYALPTLPVHAEAFDLFQDDQEDTDQTEVIGYLVGIPVIAGLYHPRFDLQAWHEHQDSETQESSAYWLEGLTSKEIEDLTRPAEVEPSELDRIGFALVQRELEALELRQQNEALGGQIVEKEIQMMNMQAQNEALGASLVGFELRLMTLESDQHTQTEGDNLHV